MDKKCPVCNVCRCSQMWHDYYQDTKHADFDEAGQEPIYKAGYETAYERLEKKLAEKDVEIERLKKIIDKNKES